MYAVPVQIPRKEADTMLNKEFFDKYFKVHNKLVLYTKDIVKLTISNLSGIVMKYCRKTIPFLLFPRKRCSIFCPSSKKKSLRHA